MTGRAARETVLLCGTLAVLLVGTPAAQDRQVPPQRPLDVLGHLLLVAAVALLIGRRRWPVATFAGSVVLVGAYLVAGYPYGPVFLSTSIAAFALASVVGAQASVVAVVAAVVAWTGVEAPTAVAGSGWTALVPMAAGFAGCLAVPVGLAAMRTRSAAVVAAAEERRRAEHGEQRLEIAREVHDVVAHNLTVIGVQAGAALKVLDADPARARTCLDAIVRTNRQALAELRGTIDLVRGGHGAPADGVEPDVAALVESARAAGRTVTYTVDGDPGGLDGAVARVVHRVVQEALTNVLRHAPGAAVGVEVVHRPGRVRVRVGDDGPGPSGPEGRGILGMRERVASVGGSLAVGPGPDGGTVVRAELPA